jgi:hypothetical protein
MNKDLNAFFFGSREGHYIPYIMFVIIWWPPLWSSGQNSRIQIQRSVFVSRRYQIFWEAVGLERGPLSLGSTTEKLFGKKSSGSGLEGREYGRSDPSRWPRGTLSPQKLTLISLTSGGRSVGIVHWRTQATEFVFHQCSFPETGNILWDLRLLQRWLWGMSGSCKNRRFGGKYRHHLQIRSSLLANC